MKAIKTVVLAGALDTKGQEYAFVKNLIEKQGVHTLVVDFGVMGEPGLEPDIGRAEVAKAGGGDIEEMRLGRRKDAAMQTMADGLPVIVRRLFDEGQLDGILAMGGGGGTAIAAKAMQALPLGVPKVLVTTVGGGDVRGIVGTKDITLIQAIVDIAGINRISGRIYTQAAGAMAGMLSLERPEIENERPLITASMFGNTTACVEHARGILEDNGYEVLVFHATGSGGRMMESMIEEGLIAACLDVTTTELADEVCGGRMSAGPQRCLTAARAGIPTILVPGCVDMANFGAFDTVPEPYQDRNLYKWTPSGTLLRTNVEENRRIGHMIAAAANAAKGPVSIVIPLRGVSMLDSVGGDFWDPEADQACFEAIKEKLKPGIPLIELDNNINDPEFANKTAETLLDMLR
ncbi:MAG: Tm-1-like ATP-binding domain-containing protein [Chloroflexota bacterium]